MWPPTQAPSPDQAEAKALAEKAAKRIEMTRKAVEDAAAVSGALWLSYVFVLLYLAIAGGTVTHVDLLLERPVRLPFLNVDLPLVPFFALAPLLFIVTHFYTLVHFLMLSAKIGQLNKALDDEAEAPDLEAENIRQALPSNIFVQLLAGPRGIRETGLGRLLKGIAWNTLVLAPILLLLLLQAQFLPYHFAAVTWLQRFAVLTDVVILWALWPAVLACDGDLCFWRRIAAWWRIEKSGRLHRSLTRIQRGFWPLIETATPLAIAFTVATFPGEWLDEYIGSISWIPASITIRRGHTVETKKIFTSIHNLLFVGDVDFFAQRRVSIFSNTLIVQGINLVETAKIDNNGAKTSFSLRGRELRGAVFDWADLRKIDLAGAELQGASFLYTQLQHTSFDYAQLQDAQLDFAQLQNASLDHAQLQGASLNWAQIQGASLKGAQLQGASLHFAQLQGVSLEGAQLQGASLIGVQLAGAFLNEASLDGASLDLANLQGASLVRAQLQGAWLENAQLQGALLDGASLDGALLFRANLQGASLKGARLRGASLDEVVLWRTNFQEAQFDRITAQGASWLAEQNSVDFREEWTHESFLKLQTLVRNTVPERPLYTSPAYQIYPQLQNRGRDITLQRIADLDPSAAHWLDNFWMLRADSVVSAIADDTTYRNSLADILQKLVCSGDVNSIFVLRNLSTRRSRLAALEDFAPEWAEEIIDNCSIRGLTNSDAEKLRGAARMAAQLQ